jgi:hypothetical protein
VKYVSYFHPGKGNSNLNHATSQKHEITVKEAFYDKKFCTLLFLRIPPPAGHSHLEGDPCVEAASGVWETVPGGEQTASPPSAKLLRAVKSRLPRL